MIGYYNDKLSAERLKRCYEIAPPRVRQYLKAEVNYVLRKIRPGDMVLELGCGYGRILSRLAQKSGWVIGIDTSLASLLLGRGMYHIVSKFHLLNMSAVQLAFRDRIFDRVICIQNGISAFHVNQQDLIRESIRVAKPGGTVLFSSYSDKFWKDRLEWFQLQSEAGLLGEIDRKKTRRGLIVCKDGFTATTVQPHRFLSLTAELNVDARIVEVDESSLFCEIIPRVTIETDD
ncbi:class I SAM-dependent methyltransferase [candidate division KSB1 bacterium]|nr:class I SAM-dependent methyltransferase [candidate division KSB1 bacterium]